MAADRRAAIRKMNEALAGEALRTLGVAFRLLPPGALQIDDVDERIEQDLVFAGLIGMIDPPRAEAKEAVARAKGAGIRPIMITGDHPVTAGVIAASLGIAENGRAVTGAQLERLSDDALDQTIKEVSVYARVSPEHKLRIVKALQRGGAIVAMTGDGVNDAPALKTADIGIAMGIMGTGCFQGRRRHGARGRQLRFHRCGCRRRTRHFLQYPKVPALSSVIEYR